MEKMEVFPPVVSTRLSITRTNARVPSTVVPKKWLRSAMFTSHRFCKTGEQREHLIFNTFSQLYCRIVRAVHTGSKRRPISYGFGVNHFLDLRMTELRERRIHLTFDDGPHPVNTPKLLDELKRAGILATFFVVGKNLEKPYAKKLVQRAAVEGHQIGNHGYSHLHMTELSAHQIREEISRTEELIGGADKGIKIFRPPYGHHNFLVDRVAQELGYRLVTWTVDTLDWDPQHKHSWVDHAMQQIVTHNINIVLAHDVHATTVANVRSLIANIRNLPGSNLIPYSEAFPLEAQAKPSKRGIPHKQFGHPSSTIG